MMARLPKIFGGRFCMFDGTGRIRMNNIRFVFLFSALFSIEVFAQEDYSTVEDCADAYLTHYDYYTNLLEDTRVSVNCDIFKGDVTVNIQSMSVEGLPVSLEIWQSQAGPAFPDAPETGPRKICNFQMRGSYDAVQPLADVQLFIRGMDFSLWRSELRGPICDEALGLLP
jgi:hypothetical protein